MTPSIDKIISSIDKIIPILDGVLSYVDKILSGILGRILSVDGIPAEAVIFSDN